MMLYQPVHRPSRQRLMTAAGLLVAVWLLWNGAYVFVAVVGLSWLGITAQTQKGQRATRRRTARTCRIRTPAEPRGRSEGIYGRYPPVQPGWFPDPQNRSQLRYFDGGSWTGYTACTGQ